ncbi:D-alanyl-lipoteichoic acid acyltransferase DltB, MBOAT superfamily [Chitinophaga terrae (ex Kim and Jung 2007)]|uniref:D-alanyl-lipoteichoic acid acyltransferase DltB, MBOAT superfamily n=1 Tax=Chitinophaga terrae (ex Kim and Jung 2007) TaxID=408074 RepID=A0A1H4DIG0_9BACT|nr:MBOAT family O-acyltransferase [Chitinophaga terrae (ex Kim and Jung 2007)]GEP92735.1 O-acyltransferase [Chitinophaga terrae (ex Kim and Jung 2007)]SEA72286.1 D-alanyl-lipoteichoic acid acyltransferase DltB, MBOAT superfamily [Chitinophaga terrae (ex Kim and Jung 2007)]
MLFNSLNFAIFLPVVFVLYWFVTNKSLKLQNLLLLLASYFFYACWDYRFLFLLIFSTFLDYFTGIRMFDAKPGMKRFWFWLSVVVNLGFLGVFKYFNFFSTSFAEALNLVGFKTNPVLLNVVLPVGISFYTFHGLSYVIDIYNNKIQPERNFVTYSVFVSFFPLLVAGPIERATHLLPQIKKERVFNYAQAVDGLKQIIWGLFKKVVIADNCAYYANMIFNDAGAHTGSTLVLGAVFFTFQIYCDFSGYSDIALGTARLFGIELLRNFAFPYFSRDIAEFWRRWHISLSSWFRDYLYIPLGGSKGGTWMKIRNTFIIFLVSGFWHGANWTFIVWGGLNALFMMPLIVSDSNRKNLEIVAQGKLFPTFRELISMLLTFSLTTLCWIVFRAEDMGHAWTFISGIFTPSLFTVPTILPVKILVLTAIFMVIEWVGREQQYAIANVGITMPRAVRWGFYYAVILAIFYFVGTDQQFIYFQF